VLAGAGLGDDARLAHAPRQHGLADDVVDLVRAGVIEVFAFEVDLSTALFAAHALRMVERRRTADEVLQFVPEFGQELRVVLVSGVGAAQFADRVGQRFADEAAAVDPEVASRVWLLIGRH